MKTSQEFDAYYQKELEPLSKLAAKVPWGCFIAIAIFFVSPPIVNFVFKKIFVETSSAFNIAPVLTLVFALVFGIMGVITIVRRKKIYKKETLASKIVKFTTGTPVKYDIHGKISIVDIKASDHIFKDEKIEGNDVVKTRVNEIEIKASNIYVPEVFNGIMIGGYLPENLPYRILIKYKLNRKTIYTPLIIDNHVFNEKFNAYSNEPESAIQFLNPAIINKIVEFENELKQEIAITIAGSKVLIAVSLSYLQEEASPQKGYSKEYVYDYYKSFKHSIEIFEQINQQIKTTNF